MSAEWTVRIGDCRERLAEMAPGSVQTCVTSPPYFGLRDYGTGEWEGGEATCDHRKKNPAVDARTSTLGPNRSGLAESNTAYQHGKTFADVCGKCGARRVDRQIGLEPTPDEFVAALVEVFREVRRALRDDGTVWLNLGDSYASSPPGNSDTSSSGLHGAQSSKRYAERLLAKDNRGSRTYGEGIKQKDLVGIPWMVAFALRADGWYLRSDIIWSKPNPMPESVTDRPTKAHEYLFLLSKGPRYFWDADAIREPTGEYDGLSWDDRKEAGEGPRRGFSQNGMSGLAANPAGRNKRSVWTVATQPYAGAHFATFPPKLIEPCILAGSPPKCCGVCGAPWRRVVGAREVRAPAERPTNKPIRFQGHADADPRDARGQDKFQHSTLGMVGTAQTVGWESTCDHDDDAGRSVVLDPFAGAGTVGVVCGWHGREFVGIELNADYAAMARERIALEGRPGGKPENHERPNVHDDQLGLIA